MSAQTGPTPGRDLAGHQRSPARETAFGNDRIDPRGRRRRIVESIALLSSGLLAGAFGYGAVNVVQTFKAVPLDVRLTFHTALMKMNGPVMQSTMGLAVLSSVVLAVLSRGAARRLAATAGALVATSFLVTRFGNVPINAKIKVWAVTTAPPDHEAILRRWEIFNDVRTGAALVAFVLLLVLASTRLGDRS
ncbi:anthrone oxygenase family protein [Micromonospora sp. NPDC093277]|uniref:anthrone oxygenase family protein n=1 Tax=Micromonospora sp. NPDC093277 TaxID=3364291 RepID=UPI003800C81A